MLRTLVARRLTDNLTRKGLARTYASPASTGSKPTWPLYLGVAGCAGLGGYVYLEWKDKNTPRSIQTKSPLDPENFIDFKLKTVVPYNHNSSKFIFELPDNQMSLIPVASCLVIKSPDPQAPQDKNGQPIIRPYTPISPPSSPGELTLLVKKYERGNASKHIHSLKPGDKLAIKGPIMKWPYKINEFDEVALIGGGSGITPLYQILNHALEAKENKTKFKLIFANITEQDILLREELDVLKKRYPSTFDIVYVLDKPDKDWKGPGGFVTKALIETHVAPASLGNKIKVFVCGPPPQVAAIAGKKDGMKQGEVGGILKELGYTSDQIFKF